ncbi:MAG TPA: phosphodiester glycosidase family protein, partial [Patescibacteria group bacterium]
GIHGTYFCPPDYASCTGKVNSYDFPVYNSRLGKFINADKLFWGGRGMIAFNGSNPLFFKEANSYGGSVTAALANYPSLLSGGQIVVDEGAYSAAGTRGAIGYGGSTLFAVIGSNISIANMAYVMQALGAQNALNLDGGGSVALYLNGYKVGPGRALPNAIIFK